MDAMNGGRGRKRVGPDRGAGAAAGPGGTGAWPERADGGYWRDRRVLITGGSAGLGRAVARAAAAAGARVVVVSRHPDDPPRDPRVSGSGTETGNRIRSLRGDVSRESDASRVAAEALTILGRIDVLVNNASTLGEVPMPRLLETTIEGFREVVETNLMGPFRLIRAVLPGMLLRREGLVVNVSSDAAISAYPGWGAYGTSKAALDQLSRIWNEELCDTGVRVLSVDPGDMDTAMHRAALPDDDPADLLDPGAVARDLVDSLPRIVRTDQVRGRVAEWKEQR